MKVLVGNDRNGCDRVIPEKRAAGEDNSNFRFECIRPIRFAGLKPEFRLIFEGLNSSIQGKV